MGRKTPWINALFACAMVEDVSLARASEIIGCPHSDLQDAVGYRCKFVTGGEDGKQWFNGSYRESLYECFKRLEGAN